MNGPDTENVHRVRPPVHVPEDWYEAYRLRYSDGKPHVTCGHRHPDVQQAAACAQQAMKREALADFDTGGRGPAWGVARVTPSGDGAGEPAHLWFLNEYVTYRSYGGPEEGGWHYARGTFVASHGEFATRGEVARTLRSEWAREYLAAKRAGLHPPGSVLSTGWPDLRVEPITGHDFPPVRPWYC